MKIKPLWKRACYFGVIVLAVLSIFSIAMESSLHAGFWNQLNERLLLERLVGEGRFVSYQRNVDTKDPFFPLEILSDGFKMINVYMDFPGSYMVEWTWRVILRNKSSQVVVIDMEYKLQDQDALLVVSSKEFSKKIAVGETVTIEKTDYLPFETAKRVKKSNWYIQFQN
jgi:hypothetical protein